MISHYILIVVMEEIKCYWVPLKFCIDVCKLYTFDETNVNSSKRSIAYTVHQYGREVFSPTSLRCASLRFDARRP